MDRIVTTGSNWLLDPGGRYCRAPRQEGPREDPDWGSVAAGKLQDFVWHDFVGVSVVQSRQTGHPRLRIVPPGSSQGIITGPIVDGLEIAKQYAQQWPCDVPSDDGIDLF